jgi:hypothetical protein
MLYFLTHYLGGGLPATPAALVAAPGTAPCAAPLRLAVQHLCRTCGLLWIPGRLFHLAVDPYAVRPSLCRAV